jgi:hypothetical protein
LKDKLASVPRLRKVILQSAPHRREANPQKSLFARKIRRYTAKGKAGSDRDPAQLLPYGLVGALASQQTHGVWSEHKSFTALEEAEDYMHGGRRSYMAFR